MPVYDCYHGTDSKAAESIVRERKFTTKPRQNHWLGNGVYFFVDDMEKAKWWAYITGRRSQYIPTVLYVPIHINKNELLNLNIEADLKMFDSYALIVKERMKAEKFVFLSEHKHEWLCFLLDSFFEDYPEFKAVKRTFESTDKYIGASGLKMLSEQLCVMNQEILDFDKISISSIN